MPEGAEVKLFGERSEQVVRVTGSIGFSEGSEYTSSPGGEEADKATDGNILTKYLNKDYNPSWGSDEDDKGLVFSTNGDAVSGLVLTSANDFSSRDPVSYRLYGSNIAVGGDQLTSTYTLINEGDISWDDESRFQRTIISFANHICYIEQ